MDLLRNLHPYKCTGPGGKHLSALADVIVLSHIIPFEGSWIPKKVPGNLKANVSPVCKRQIISSKGCFWRHSEKGDGE